MSVKPHISIIIPVYGCAQCIQPLIARIRTSLSGIRKSYEVILVDDGSVDGGWMHILDASRSDPRVEGIRLSRNFGQHHAITAGVDAARGDWVVVMDCDLQDRPEEIVRLYRHAASGKFDIVFARRRGRKDGMRNVISVLFHSVFAFLSGMRGDTAVGNFSIARREAVDVVRSMTEQNRSYLQSLKWAGFRQGYLDVVHAPRVHGRTSYTLPKLVGYAIDSITAHSDRPLKGAIWAGFLAAIFSFGFGLVVIVRYLFRGIPITGWPSLIVSVYFLAGLIFLFLGILGLYIGKIFDEIKDRPLYVIAQRTKKGRA